MVVNGLDMNYVGVSNVWTNDMGSFFLQSVFGGYLN